MLCLSGFELYSRWVPLYNENFQFRARLSELFSRQFARK